MLVDVSMRIDLVQRVESIEQFCLFDSTYKFIKGIDKVQSLLNGIVVENWSKNK